MEKKLQVRIDMELYEAILKACKEENRNISNLIRTALIYYLNNK